MKWTILNLGLVLVAVAGCRTVHPVDTTARAYEPLFERDEVRSRVGEAQRQLATEEGLEREVARLTATFWSDLSSLQRQPLSDEEGRRAEATILAQLLAGLDALALPAPEREGADAEATQVTVTLQGLLDAAEEAAAGGRYELAVGVAEAVLDRLPAERHGAALTSYLCYRIGMWQLAAGRFDAARESFACSNRAVQRLLDESEQARLMSEQLDLLAMLPPGPERDELARGWALLEMGDAAGAADIGRTLAVDAADGDVAREAGYLVSEAELVLADSRQQLEAEVAAEAAAQAAEAARQDADWSTAADEAAELVAQERFREAAAVYGRFADTDLAERAAAEAARTLDILVREQRKRAGDLFVAAQQEGDGDACRAMLEEARTILAGLVEEFPESTYADRVQRNLAAVEQALGEEADVQP